LLWQAVISVRQIAGWKQPIKNLKRNQVGQFAPLRAAVLGLLRGYLAITT